MVFIWRGFGIIVPISFLICAWLVSYWIPDPRFGNMHYLGWVLFYGGIVNTLLGLGVFAPKGEDEYNKEPGEVLTEARGKKKNDFFFIPIIVWGLFFLGFSAYLLMGDDSDPSEELDIQEDRYVDQVDSRIINFYNPNQDTMYYLIENLEGLEEVDEVAPFSFVSKEYDVNSYWIMGFNYEDEATQQYPVEKYKDDVSKYVLVEEEIDGKMIKFFQRILNPETPDEKDYDEAWVILDKEFDLILVDVSSACDETITKGEMRNMNWLDFVEEVYDGADMVEPLYNKRNGSKIFTVLGPGEAIPLSIDKKEVIYALIPVANDVDISSEYIAEMLIALNVWN